MSAINDGAKRFFDWNFAIEFCAAQLTGLPYKARYYGAECGFREGLYHLASRGTRTYDQVGDRVRAVGLGMFRPDAIHRGSVPVILDYFRRIGVRPFFAVPVEVTPAIVREIWRYQFNVASGERMVLQDMLFGASESILTLFEFPGGEPPVPCAVLMADVKGRALPVNRQGWEMRAHVQSSSYVEVHMHTADEPADVVRDAAILLGAQEAAAAIDGAGANPDVSEDILDLAASIRASSAARARVRVPTGPITDQIPPSVVVDEDGYADRWDLIRRTSPICEMYGGPGENLIHETGTDHWWARAGLLGSRTDWLSTRAGWAPDVVDAKQVPAT